MVGPQVVHDEHVAAPQLGEQMGGEPRHEADPIRGGEHRPEDHPAVDADRSEEGERRAPIHGNGVDVLCAALHPGVTPAHREVQAGFVEKHQPSHGNPAHLPQEGAPLDLDVWPRRLQRPAPFFFTT